MSRDLPGEPLIWVLILSELAVFGAGLVALGAAAAVLAGRQAMRQDAVLAVREDW